VGRLGLAFAPVTDSLLVTDEVGWDALGLIVSGAGPGRVRRRLAARYGSAAADRCLQELEPLTDPATGLLTRPDPLAEPELDPEVPPSWTPGLRALCLNVAHDCDLRCRYCFAGTGRFGGRRSLMSAAVAREAVDFLLAEAKDAPSLDIDFFGGEPLLAFEVVRETVDYGRRRAAETGRRLSFTLTTNAASLGPDEAAYLAETMDNVVLSLDGRPEVHDRMRRFAGGRGSHRPVLDNILAFLERRGSRDYWVRGTYTAFNLDFTADVAYLADQGITNISLEPAVGGGSAAWALRPEHLPRLREEYVRLADYLDAKARAGRRIRFFHFITETDAGPCYAKRVRGCGAGREYLAVTPDGEVFPCHQFVGQSGFSLGRLDGRLRYGPQDAAVGRLWLGSKPACRSCWARYRCSGGCHANAWAATGDLLRPDPLGCAIIKTRLEAGLYLQALQVLRDLSPAVGGRSA